VILHIKREEGGRKKFEMLIKFALFLKVLHLLSYLSSLSNFNVPIDSMNGIILIILEHRASNELS